MRSRSAAVTLESIPYEKEANPWPSGRFSASCSRVLVHIEDLARGGRGARQLKAGLAEAQAGMTG
jgi:hypothetical protein